MPFDKENKLCNCKYNTGITNRDPSHGKAVCDPDFCNRRGQVVNGVCVCDTEFIGDKCQYSLAVVYRDVNNNETRRVLRPNETISASLADMSPPIVSVTFPPHCTIYLHKDNEKSTAHMSRDTTLKLNVRNYASYKATMTVPA